LKQAKSHIQAESQIIPFAFLSWLLLAFFLLMIIPQIATAASMTFIMSFLGREHFVEVKKAYARCNANYNNCEYVLKHD